MSRNRNGVSLLARTLRRVLVALTCLLLLLGCAVAQDNAAVPNPAVPNLVKFSGTFPSTPAGSVGVIFALYKDQTGGAPLWQEVQNVTVDASGHYTSLLGSSTAAGIPLDVFSSNEARWLGVQLQGQPEQPRVLLVSVPYALKAADAQTLGGLPPSAFLRADAATTSTPAATTAYVNAAAVNAAVGNAVAAAIGINGTATAGTLPVFADASGNLTNSDVAQSGSNVGIGTASPIALLHLLGTNPTMRIENYSNTSGDSPNFNFYSASGTAGAPLPTANGDNLGQFAAAGLPQGAVAFGGSKVKITFQATENWGTTPPMGNGTAMSFQTTANGTTARTSRMFIDNTGNVGIGSNFGVPANGGTPPPYALSVTGAIQSTGGIIFPDGTPQTTAAVSGVALTSDASITVGGTATAPTVAVNTATIQKRVTGACAVGMAVASVNADGSVNCGTGPQGPPGPASPVVKDASGNALGTLIAMGGPNGTDVTIYTHGYFVTVGITGQFPVAYPGSVPGQGGAAGTSYLLGGALLWTGATCNGTAALYWTGSSTPTNFPSTYTKNVVYSALSNQLFVPTGTGATAVAVSVDSASAEVAGYSTDYTYADGVSNCIPFGSSITYVAWPLTPINPAATLGWTVSGNPLAVAGPLQLP